MITLALVNRYASANNISPDTDIFSILSQMQLKYEDSPNVSPASGVEYSVNDLLNLFDS